MSRTPPSAPPSLADELLIDAEIDDDGVQQAPVPTTPRWLLVAGLVLIGINLRPALSSLAPVLGQIKTEIGISATMAGLLTTLPVLCLGLFGPLAPQLNPSRKENHVPHAPLCTAQSGGRTADRRRNR
ncbi:hypothetical protein [Aquitalea magnusonii]|uniref:hypothetical protein n=1 Tax=Aquitalea magnusonii TaxID=332411 RepID=UPI0007501E0D|nr:hypothetical protein [Aquitalea magnusonii]